MTPEEKQRLLIEIDARHEKRKATMRSDGGAAWSPIEAHADVGRLLSLVKEQEVPSAKDDDLGRFVLRCIRGCATDDQYIETLERVKTAFVSVRDDAATAMRSACVEALKRRANNYLSSQSGLAGMEVRTELEAAAKELESLSIEKSSEEQKQ